MKLPLLSKILKLSVYKNALMSKGLSALAFISAASVTFTSLFKDVFSGELYKNLIILVTLMLIALLVYCAFWSLDFYTGTRASKQEYFNKTGKTSGWAKSELLYSSFGKLGGVLLIKFMMAFICFATLLVKLDYGFYTAIGVTLFLDVLSFGFEAKSIGENLERKTGKKPKLFVFLDKLFNSLENGAIKKIDKQF